MFSNGKGTAFCAIGALAHDYCGWDGKSTLCPTDGKYYIAIPTWTRRVLKEMLSQQVYEHIMLVNDGAKKQNGYVPVIEYLKGLGL
jgi:hypothetical protein